jgi:hypothetical protein
MVQLPSSGGDDAGAGTAFVPLGAANCVVPEDGSGGRSRNQTTNALNKTTATITPTPMINRRILLPFRRDLCEQIAVGQKPRLKQAFRT